MVACCMGCAPSATDAAPDECVAGRSRPCGTSAGECELGREMCVAGRWSGACEGGVVAIDERCDGLRDDDCDGMIDEGSADCPLEPGVGAVDCRGGRCEVIACTDPAYGNCSPSDGVCATELVWWDGCGACGLRCADEEACRAGSCEPISRRRRAIALGGPLDDWLTDVAVGSDDSVFVLVSFEGTITVGTETHVSPGSPGTDLLIVKLDREGEVLWARATESSFPEEALLSPAPDGGVYLYCRFGATTRFAGRDITVPPGDFVTFVARIGGDGEIAWTLETADAVTVHAVSSTVGGLVIAMESEAGMLGGRALPDGGSIVVLSADGAVVGAIPTPPATSIEVTDRGSVVLSGIAQGSVAFGDHAPVALPGSFPVPFVAEVDLISGDARWVRAFEGVDARVLGISSHERGVDALAEVTGTLMIGDASLDTSDPTRPTSLLVRFDSSGEPRITEPWGVARGVAVEALGSDDVVVVSSDRREVLAYSARTTPRWTRSLSPAVLRRSAHGERVLVVGGTYEYDTSIDGVPISNGGERDVVVWWIDAR